MPNVRVTPNAKQEKIDIVGGSTFGKYSKISAAKTFNCYLTDAGIEGEDKEIAYVGFPGYQRVLNLLPYPSPYPTPPVPPDEVPAGEGRGIFNCIRGGFFIVVVNQNVYRLSDSLGKTLIGSIDSAIGEVFMAENLSSQICIVDGKDMWIYNYSPSASNVLTKQTGGAIASGALIPSYVEYHETFFLIGNSPNASSSQSWYVYSRASDTTITQVSPAGQFTMTTKPDFALAVKKIPGKANNILVFGSTVCEVWTYVGGSERYSKNQSVSINYGCQSTSTIADGADILVWLGINEDESPVITVYNGEEIKPISTDGIDFQLGKINHPEISTAMLYREDGHLFYILTFYDPSDNLTLMYDFNTGLFFNLTNQNLDFHPARGIVYYNLKTYFISLRNAALYQMGSQFTVLNENLPRTSPSSAYNANLVYEIQKMRVTSNIRLADGGRFIANSLTFTLEQGCDPDYTGSPIINYLITESTFNPADDEIITETGDDIVDEDSATTVSYIPRIDLAFSKDGGVTWSDYVSRNLNALGYRQNMLHWEGMGAANDICFTFRFWTNNRFIAFNGLVDLVI